jgi:hypothetical protein
LSKAWGRHVWKWTATVPGIKISQDRGAAVKSPWPMPSEAIKVFTGAATRSTSLQRIGSAVAAQRLKAEHFNFSVFKS